MAMIKFRASSNGTSLADKISVMSIDELMNATQAKESGRTARGAGGAHLLTLVLPVNQAGTQRRLPNFIDDNILLMMIFGGIHQYF